MPATGDRITKRKDGLFQGMYTAQTPDGPKRKYVYGRKYGEVQKKLAKAMGDVARGIVFDDKNLTVGEYLDHFLEDVQRGSLEDHHVVVGQVGNLLEPVPGEALDPHLS